MADLIEPPPRFYVYILYHDAGMLRPFYVGMGSGKRLQYHHGERWQAGRRGEIIRDLKRTLGLVPNQKIAEDLTKAAAYALERELIKQIGRMPDGPLVNVHHGGGGSNGRLGRPVSPETRAKISASLTGKKQSPETIAKRAAAVGLAHRGKKRGPQPDAVRKKRAASLSLAHQVGRFLGTGMTGKKHSAATRAQMSETAKRNGHRPPVHHFGRPGKLSKEVRLRMSIAQQARRQREKDGR